MTPGIHDPPMRHMPLIALCLLTVACASAPEPLLPGLGLTWRELPRIDGSTSTEPLSVTLLSRLLGLPVVWKRYGPKGEERRLYADRDAQDESHAPGIRAWLERDGGRHWTPRYYDLRPGSFRGLADLVNWHLARHTGTHDAYEAIVRGDVDLAIVARGPSSSELDLAREEGVALRVEEVALDALVFLVHRDNPIEDLFLEAIRDLAAGRVARWSELGGEDEEVVLYQRDRDSGSRELLEDLVMRGTPAAEAGELMIHTMEGVFIALADEPRGFSYSVDYYARYMIDAPEVKMLAVGGVLPTPESIGSGAYPLVTSVMLATREGMAPDDPAEALRRWILSPEGQAVARESGYVTRRGAREPGAP